MIPTRVFLIAAEGDDSAKKEKNRTKITKYGSFLENGSFILYSIRKAMLWGITEWKMGFFP